jgi:hypothetical protein
MKIMKNLKFIAIIALLISFSVNAQQYGMRRNMRAEKSQTRIEKRKIRNQKIMERKLAFMKENLMLTKQEGKEFEKAYLIFEVEQEKLQQQYKEEVVNKVKKGNVNELSENEQKKIIDTKLKIDAQKFDLKQNYHIQLTKILPSIKVIRYFKLEREFKRKMLNKLKHQRNNHKRRGGNNNMRGRR